MAYTEYLDIVIRNQGKLDALEKQTKAIRDNLEAISRGPAAVAAPSATQPPTRQGRQRRGPRLSDALGADLNELTQSVGRVIRETDQFTRRQEQRLTQRAQRLTSELRGLTAGDSRALRGVRQTTRLQQARESRRSLRQELPASQRPGSVTQKLRGTLKELAQADARQLREIEELTAPFLGGSGRPSRTRRTPIRGASNPNLITGFVETGGGGSQPPRQPPRPPSPPTPPSGGPPDDPDRFRRRVGQVQTRVRFAERYGPQLPSPDAAERSLAYQARLNAQVRQYQGQLIKARQIVGPARDEVVRIAKAWEDAGGAQIKSLALAQAYSRELRALNTEQVAARSLNQFQQRGPGQRALIEGRARAVASELPEAQRPALLDSVRSRLQAQEEALNQGNRSEAFQQERLAAQEIALRRQEVAESKRAERRARAPQQARTAANRAQRLSRQANEIEIPRNTPLGQELFNQAAAIASEAGKQERALRQSVASGKATTDSVKALTANITELRSAFETLKTRAQPLQQAARDAETELQRSRRNGVSSPIRGGAAFEGSPAFLRDQALQRERQRRAEVRNAISSPVRGGANFPGSPAFEEAQQRRADLEGREQDRIEARRRREAEQQRRQRERQAEQQRRAELRNAASSPIRGGVNFAGSPLARAASASLSSRAESLSLRAEGTVANARAIQQDPSTSPALRDRARQAEVIAQGTLNKLSREGNQLTSEGLTTEGKRLNAVRQRLQIAKQQAGVEEKQQQIQREGVSLGSFKKNIGRVLGGGGDTQDFESLALGAGFPLLFGGGPGSIAGGLLGSFVGKGFGGQILGGAIGQIVDELIASTSRLGNALNDLTGNFDALRNEGIRVSSDLERRITEQRRAGDFTGATQTLRAEVGAQMGDVGGLGLQQSTAAVNALSASWDKIYKTAGLTVSLVAGPFVVALTGVLEVANGLLSLFNAVNTGIAATIRLIPGAAQLGDFVANSFNDATGATQSQLSAIREINEELVRRGSIEEGLGRQRTAASGLSGANRVQADAQIAAAERRLAFEEEIDKLRKEAPANEKAAQLQRQQIAIRTKQFERREEEEIARTRIAADAAALQATRERQDRERALNRETEALLRRQEDLAQSQIDLARQEFDLQRSIADFRIRTEDQVASRRADLIRQELEIARIRGQIEDSQISGRFDRQIEAAPNDQASRILSAAKEEELARKALERTIRDGRIETALRIDQIERQSRQEQRALENDRIALERQRDSVIRARVAIERQTEDLKRDTADYQLSIARQVEDSAIRAAAALRAANAGLLGGAEGAAAGGPLAQEVLSGFDRIKGATSFRTKGTSGVRGAISPDGGNEYFDFNGAARQAVASRIATWTKKDWTAAITTALGEGKPGRDVYNVIANIAARSAKEPSASVSDLVTRPQQYVANAKRGLNINNIGDPAFGRKLFGARFDQLLNQIGSGRSMMMPSYAGGGQVIGRTGNTGISSGPHTDVRWADGRPISAADADRFLSIGGRAPSSYGVTSGYGPRRPPVPGASTFHRGIDFGTPAGLPVALRGGATFAGGLSAAQSGGGGITGIINTPMGQMKVLHLERVLNMPGGGRQMAPSAPLPGVGVGTAPFDLKAQAARDKQLQRERQQAEEALKREELRRREEETLREVVGEQSVVRKREELELTTRIAAAGVQSTETEQRLLELRIANTREQELLTQAVERLGPLTKEREAALAAGLANKREELKIAEALLEIEKQRAFQQELVSTQREIQNFASGIDAGFGVGTQASSAFAGVKNRGGTDEQARRQADAVRTLTLLQETVQDAQSIGGSIGDGIRNALIASVTGGDIRQAFSAMLATIGNTLIQSALRPIEQLITDQAFSLLRPNITAEAAAIKQNVAASQQEIAAIKLNLAADQLIIAANAMQANSIAKTAFGGGGSGGLAGQLVGSLFSGAGPVTGAFGGGGGLSTNIITDLFSGALGFAAGGNPPIGQPAWVGEQGPELSVARGLSTIIPNETSTRLWDSLSSPGAAPGEGGMAGGEVAISYDGPTLVFDSTNYVKQDDVPKIVDRAVKQSFGYSQRRMQESPAARRAAGMR